MGCTDFAFTVPAGVVDKAFTAVRASDVVDSDKLFSRLIADGLQK
jgi:hypothetical protein